MVYILTNTEDLLEVNVKALECRQGDGVAEAFLSLALKEKLSNASFNEQELYLSNAAIAAYVSLNKLDQRQRFRASLNLSSVKQIAFDFNKGSSSSGLGYALAIFESWWINALNKPSQYGRPVFATGEVLTSGALNPVGHINDKIDSILTYVSSNTKTIDSFYLCLPEQNLNDISPEQLDKLKGLGCILISGDNVQTILGQLLDEAYDGDPLGRWEPFKGLNNFEYEDSVRFFGREKDVQRLYDDLNQNKGLLIVSGASGTGKSSLIKAGLIPYLERKNKSFYWCSATPSQVGNIKNSLSFLIDNLSTAFNFNATEIELPKVLANDNTVETLINVLTPRLKGNSKGFLFYIDQYEESFNHKDLDDVDSALYLGILNEISSAFDHINIVIALRSEYLGKILENQALSSPVISNISSQLSIDSWEAIVYEQAQFSGISFETNSEGVRLDKKIIEQASKTPYSLPMVSFLLEQLYLKEKKNGSTANILSFKSYDDIGGLTGAIAYRAKTVLSDFSADNNLIDSFFENFVGLNSESLPYARHVKIEDVKAQDLNLYELVIGFIDANLIVYTDGSKNTGVLKFSHDSLFTNWHRLKNWIESFKDYLLWRNSIDGQFQRWTENNQKEKVYLLKDKRLIKEGLSYITKKILKNNVLIGYIKDSRSKNNRYKLNIAFIFVLLPGLIGSYFYWDNNRIKSYYYEDIGKRWEVPFGVNEINKEQIKRRYFHYLFEYQAGVLRRVKKLNSAGILFDEDLKDVEASWFYSYTDDGNLNNVIIKTKLGKTVAINKYQFSSENKAVLTYSKDIVAVGFSSGIPLSTIMSGRKNQGKSKISRKVLEFYSNGLLKKITYQDPYGENVADYNGYFGEAYLYNEFWFKTEEFILNKNHQAISNDRILFEYDVSNRVINKHRGNFTQKIERDSWSNVTQLSSFINNIPMMDANGHKVINKYDSNGFLKEIKKVDLKNELFSAFAAGVAKATRKYDSLGNTIERSFYGIDNNLIINRDLGAVTEKIIYNSRNQPIEFASYGLLGERAIRTEGNVLGFFKNKIIYDERGNRRDESYYGINDEPISSSNGVFRVKIKYDENDNVIERRWFGVNGKPTLGSYGYYLAKFVYDSRSNLTYQSHYGLDEEPIITSQGFYAVTNEYDDDGRVTEEATYDIDGRRTLTNDGMAILRMKYDQLGNQIELSYFDVNDKSVLDYDDNVAKVITHFDGGESIGRPSGFEYFGVNGKPTLNRQGVSKSVIERDQDGRMIGWASYGVSGELVIAKGQQHSSLTKEYHPNGNNKRDVGFYIDGSYNEWIGDINGKSISFSFYDKDDKPILGPGVFSGSSKSLTSRDEYGNIVEQNYFDEKGDPGVNKHGISKKVYLKDKNDVLTHIWVGYDIDGNVMRGFNTKLTKIKGDKQDKIFWDYVVSVDTKESYQFYIDFLNNGLFREKAQQEILKFTSNLVIKGLDEGSLIFLNDSYVGFQKINLNIKPGEYKLSLNNVGYKTLSKIISVKESQTLDLAFSLEKDSSVLEKESLLELALNGDSEAQKTLGNKYLADEKYDEAMSWYLKSSEQSYLPAIHNIGYLYATGKGVQKDFNESYKWYKKAAVNGFGISQIALAAAYEKGEGVEKSFDRSMFWFHKAAEQGFAYAQFRVATSNILNEKEKPYVFKVIEAIEALNYLKGASAQDYKPAFRYLGYMYESLLVVDLDLEKAIYWYEKAFNEDEDLNAAYLLGLIFYEGKGVPIDFDKAIYWLEKAANKGHVTSASFLAQFYLESTSFTKDREKGLRWLKLAAKMNDSYAINKLKGMQDGICVATQKIKC